MQQNNLMVISIGIVAAFVLGIVLQQLNMLLLPFTIAILFSIIFEPIIRLLKAKKIPMAVCLLAVLLLVSLVTVILGALLYVSAESLIQKLPTYDEKLEAVISKAMTLLQDMIHKLGLQMETANTGQVLQLTTISADAVSSALQSFMDFLGRAATVLLFMLFMLAGSGSLSDKIQHAYSPGDAYRILAGLQNISTQVRQYLVTKVFISLLTGVLTSLVLWLLGIEFPIFWGFLACLLNFIPYAGPLLALACPLVLALLQFDTLTRPLLALVMQGAMYAIIGNVVEPKLMASRLNVSVLLVLVSLIFWGWLWGLWGMILAVPLTITVKIIFENIGPLYPLSVLMSERVSPNTSELTATPIEPKEQTYDRI